MHLNAEARKTFEGAHLICDLCGKVKMPTIAQIQTYLSYGWPAHCGKAMRLITREEQEAKAV